MELNHTRIKAIERKYEIRVSEYWLKLLLGMEPHEVGVVKTSGKLIEGQPLETIVGNYQTLDTELALKLPLVIGGGPQYDKLPAYKHSGKVNGIRVTTPELLGQMLPVARLNLDNVVHALTEGGVSASPMPYSVFRVKRHGIEVDQNTGQEIDTGFVGDVVHVDTAPVIASLYEGRIPVISHIGIDESGQHYNINATPAAAALVKWLQAYKLIILGDKAILDTGGKTIPEIKSPDHLDDLLSKGVVGGGMALNAQEAYDLLRIMGPGRTVQITTPANLIAELLTDGAGTIIRMPFVIQSFFKPEHFSNNGRRDLTEMIDHSFTGRGQILVGNYWNGHPINQHPVVKIYADTEKTGGVVVRDLEGTAYICKLFTHPDYRGRGLATQIMERVVSDYGGFMLRTKASPENKAEQEFYKKFIDKLKGNGLAKPGMVTDYQNAGNYLVVGVNIAPDKWDALKGKVASLPSTLI